MKLSEVFVKIVGLILIGVGLALVLAALGVQTFLGLSGPKPDWLAIFIGLVLIGAGVVLIRGGNITL